MAALNRRAFLMVAALLVTVIMLLTGLGILSKRALQYAASTEVELGLQALAAAEAGIEDARIKLSKDQEFPSRLGPDQRLFSYSEELTDLDGNRVGSYTVLVDSTLAQPPASRLVVTSEGSTGPRDGPTARRVVRAELSVATREILNFQDLGSL